MSRPRILIVEDSPAMRHLLNMASKRNADVSEAADGLQALKLLAQERYDLMFVDLNMPVLDGMKLIKRVREDTAFAGMRICVVTTESSLASEEQARTLGADYFLRKPIHRRDVDAILAQTFGGA